MIRPEIIGIEIGHVACRGVRIDPLRNEIVSVGEVPFGPHGLDRDGVIEPSVVAMALDTLVVRLGIDDRSRAKAGLSIGPRNAGVGSGPAMSSWLQAQATTLGQPLVCSGALGLAFAPIRSVDQAVKTAFDIGLDLARIDLAPVAAVRAVGDQVDDLICVGSGRGWQARMRDFEVLEAMENHQIGPEEPISFHSSAGTMSTLTRYGWVDLSIDLLRSQQVDIGRMATATGVAIGVLHNSPANLLDGKVMSGQPARDPAPQAAPIDSTPIRVRAESTLQLGVIQIPEQPSTSGQEMAPRSVAAPAAPTAPAAPSAPSAPAGAGGAVATTNEQPRLDPRRSAVAVADPSTRRGWGDEPVSSDDPINLFSPDTDEVNMLGRRRFSPGFKLVVIALVIIAAGLGLVYLFG